MKLIDGCKVQDNFSLSQALSAVCNDKILRSCTVQYGVFTFFLNFVVSCKIINVRLKNYLLQSTYQFGISICFVLVFIQGSNDRVAMKVLKKIFTITQTRIKQKVKKSHIQITKFCENHKTHYMMFWQTFHIYFNRYLTTVYGCNYISPFLYHVVKTKGTSAVQ